MFIQGFKYPILFAVLSCPKYDTFWYVDKYSCESVDFLVIKLQVITLQIYHIGCCSIMPEI